ncbi:O-antigen acetylase [Chromobacterium vaccinii]|uniref:acyltransferase family protein n=1 Tax=Chromobacterium vaccinii TaxID=1108595 RepID=UPI000CE93C4F|nr:acyltransferase [Chromobacterium vaccinii]AVG15007.1 O-antigen acetylase [Chromobacterium vaccinii]
MSSIEPRNPRVDCLRGIAIGSVLLLHFMLAYGLKDSLLGSLLSAPLLGALARNGNYGVTMFFVVSGFLIVSQSLRRWGSLPAIDIRAFYVRRFARIMPLLLPTLALIVALGSLGLPHFSNTDGGHHLPASYFWLAAGSVLTFWHNQLMQSVGYFNYCLNVYWSLSVEEVFYLALPLLCLGLRRTWLLAAVCLLLIVAGPLYRAAHLDNEIDYLYGNLACFDAIAIGCLAALAAHRVRLADGQARLLRWAGLLMLGGVYLRGIAGHQVFGFSWVALASAAFLLGAARAPRLDGWRERATRPLRWLGRHSYELYLLHIVVLAGLRNLLPRDAIGYWERLPLLCAFVAASSLLAYLAARYWSEPCNRAIRRRWLRRRGEDGARLSAERGDSLA